MDKALLIAGTGTGVGKTVVSALLLGFLLKKGIRVSYQKWVSTGGEMPEDLVYCLEKNNLPFCGERLDSQVLFRFRMPASPHLAAEREGRRVDPERIKTAFWRAVLENDLLLVEGVGGVMVPLRRDLLLCDFLPQFQMPVLIVARSGLGTINHTLLTIESLRHRNIPLLGVVFSDEECGMAADDPLVADNLRIIGELGGLEVFGRLPRFADYTRLQEAFVPVGERIGQRIFSGLAAERSRGDRQGDPG